MGRREEFDTEKPHRESWEAGSRACFEYHCYEGHDSADAEAWYRSHQNVTVLKRNDPDPYSEGMTQQERSAEGVPHTYRVRWDDGFEHDAWEDELMTHPKHFWRPDPPQRPA